MTKDKINGLWLMVLVLLLPFITSTLTRDALLIKFFIILFFLPVFLYFLSCIKFFTLKNVPLTAVALYFLFSQFSFFDTRVIHAASNGLIYFLFDTTIFLFAYSFFRQPAEKKRVLFLMMSSLTVSGILFIMEKKNIPLVLGAHSYQVNSGMGNQNVLAHALVVTIPLSVLFITNRKSSIAARVISVISLVVQVYSLKLTESRAGILGVVSASSFLLLHHIIKKIVPFKLMKNIFLQVLVIFIIVFAGAGIFVVKNKSGLKKIISFESADSLRWAAWKDSMKIWETAPLLGVGLNNYSYHIPLMYNSRSPAQKKLLGIITIERAHNDYLQILTERGTLGLGAWILIIILCLKYFNDYSKAPEDAFLLVSIAGTLVHALFDFNLEMPVSRTYFFILLGFLFSGRGAPASRVGVSRAFRLSLVPVLLFVILFPLSGYVSQGYFKIAKNAHDNNNYSAAMPAYNNAMNLSENNYLLPFRAGLLEEDKGKFVKSSILMNKSISLHPFFSNPRYHLATISFKKKDYPEAGKYFRTANVLRMMPETLLNMGHVFTSMNDYPRAVGYYKMAYFLDNDFYDAAEIIARLLYKEKKIDRAINWMKRSLSLHKKDKLNILRWGKWIDNITGNKDVYREGMLKWILSSSDFNKERYLSYLAYYYFNNNRIKDTEWILSRSETAGVASAGLMYISGKISFIKKNYSEAEKDFLKSVEIDDKFAKSYLFLGHVGAYRGDWEAAVKYYEHAIDAGLHTPEVYFNLGLQYQRLKRNDKALEYFNKTLDSNPPPALRTKIQRILTSRLAPGRE